MTTNRGKAGLGGNSSGKIYSVLKKLIQSSILPACLVSVVIPVRDEAGYLSKSLDALANQVDLQNRPLNADIYEVIVLANNCVDDSAQTARDWRTRHPRVKLHVAEISLPPKRSNVGFVRRTLMNEAFRRLTANRFGGIIATTDGDTRVAPDWIARTIEEIKRGADAVGGRILIEAAEMTRMDERARRFHLLDEKYRLLVAEYECHLDQLVHDVRPRHHQHFNGSFAVTTEAFARAGGIPDVPFLEDIAFYHALLRIDAKVRHSPSVKVFTSSRHLGRSRIGLSFQLNEWKKMGEKGAPLTVEPARAIRGKVTARKVLRELWLAANSGVYPKPKTTAALAERLCVPRRFVFKELQKPQTFGSLLEKIYRLQHQSRRWHRRHPLIAVEAAILDLENKLACLRAENPLVKAKSAVSVTD